jgi:glycolate oxidase iron-sulfur subunit
MQTRLSPKHLLTETGKEAEQILRNCVHCGFCTATCPTYQLLGDELDGPRGRIYQIKQFLEGAEATPSLQIHLDRCLLCRACETTCPSGVEYGRLLETAREQVEKTRGRKLMDRWQRFVLRKTLPYPIRLKGALALARPIRFLLPESIKKSIPATEKTTGSWPDSRHSRKMLILDGCVQSVLKPSINHATAEFLDRLGISLLRPAASGCCGAVDLHLGDAESARRLARRNIDSWWPHLEAGAEAILVTASGCAQSLKDYAHLLKADHIYAEKASRVADAARDLIEVVEQEDLDRLEIKPESGQKIAFHAPCTLQHGQKLPGRVEALLENLGFQLARVDDPHLCCGSAGTYSILQPELADRLGNNKIRSLERDNPEMIVTANIGCLNHLQPRTSLTVLHWIELITRSTQ